MRFVVDTSVAIKWFVDEGDSADALMLRTRHRLLAPDLLLAEMANVLSTKVRLGDMVADKAGQAAEAILGSGIAFNPINGLVIDACRFAVQLSHPAYDCFYLALALQERCVLVTADKRFLTAVQRYGLPEHQAACTSLSEAIRR